MTTIDKIALGKRINAIRLSLAKEKTSQTNFGALLDPAADKTLVAKWENGVYIPNNIRLKQIAELGGVTLDDLLFGEQKHTSEIEANRLFEPKGYGERIKNIRQQHKLTLEGFGKIFTNPASKTVVWNWERERNLPNKERLYQIAELGNVSVDFLIYGKESTVISHTSEDRKNTGIIDKIAVGERIKRIRLNCNEKPLTLQQFAELLNPPSDKSSVRKWEKGFNLPNKKRISQIASIGNTTVDFLIFGNTTGFSLNDKQNELFEEIKHVFIWQHSHTLDLIFYLIEPNDSVFEEKTISLFRSLSEKEQLQVINFFTFWVLTSDEAK